MNNSAADYAIEVFFDGGCPLCRREIAMLRRWDRRQRIRFTDIDADSFDASAVGKSYEELMAQMQGRLSDGTWVKGVEVFRRLYAAVGFVRLAKLSRLPLISHLLDFGYAIFARYRLRLTRRCPTSTCAVKLKPRSIGR